MTAAALIASLSLFAAGVAPPSGDGEAGRAETTSRPNVLLIVVDDLRPELGCYGAVGADTPHLDAFAQTATRFDRAYCQVPTCGASRASLFTGLRPTRQRFRSYLTRIEEDAPDVTPLHAHFRANGYRTASLGKVLHHKNDSAAGWSDPPWRPRAPMYATDAAENPPSRVPRTDRKGGKHSTRGLPTEAAEVDDDFYADGQIAAEAVERLNALKRARDEGGAPWLLAVGFLKPHLPFVAPQKYWDRHPAASIEPPLNYEIPKNAPGVAIHTSGELRSYAGIPAKGPVSDEQALRLIRGYRACVSYADANVGRVLAALDAAGADGNTVVVVTSDHGWNLGEHTLWCKHSCFETSLGVPLLIRAPGVGAAGGATDALTELLDLYPTLCDLTGLPAPAHLQGSSLTDRLRDPGAAAADVAVSRYGPGDTIRTDALRFTEYTAVRDGEPKVIGRMLYDHEVDPGETVNVASTGEHEADAAALLKRLNAVAGDRAERAGLR